MRRTLLCLLLATLLSAPCLGYTIYLKDGSRLLADGKYQVRGENALIKLPNGTQTSIKLSEIDIPRTERANETDLGGAVVVEGGEVLDAPPPPTEQEDRPRLSDVAAQRQLPRSLNRAPQSSPTAIEMDVPRTPAGNVDLMRLQRQPFQDTDLGGRILVGFRNRGVEEVALYRGTAPDRVFVEVTTNSEASVFRALGAAAQVVLDVTARSSELAALEIFMANDRRLRAGQFLITPERAQQLVSGELDEQRFFVEYVEF